MSGPEPWIEVEAFGNTWQAQFAARISVLPFAQLQRLRWGFNSQALYQEALDRQKLFIEAQFNENVLKEETEDHRTLALRTTGTIVEAEMRLIVAVIGKIQAASAASAREQCLDYCRGVTSIFPCDYQITPAVTQGEYHSLTGKSILDLCQTPGSLAQILRFEAPVRTQKNLVYVNGFWQTGEHSEEQIWRALGNYHQPILLNIFLRPTNITHDERQILWDMTQNITPSENISAQHKSPPLDQWVEPLIKRRLSPWKKYYYLQIHLACPAGVPETLIRAIGSALTRESQELVSPGYIAKYTSTETMSKDWANNLTWLNFQPGKINKTSVARLSDVADLSEVTSVFRLPYPPEPGFGVVFLK